MIITEKMYFLILLICLIDNINIIVLIHINIIINFINIMRIFFIF